MGFRLSGSQFFSLEVWLLQAVLAASSFDFSWEKWQIVLGWCTQLILVQQNTIYTRYTCMHKLHQITIFTYSFTCIYIYIYLLLIDMLHHCDSFAIDRYVYVHLCFTGMIHPSGNIRAWCVCICSHTNRTRKTTICQWSIVHQREFHWPCCTLILSSHSGSPQNLQWQGLIYPGHPLVRMKSEFLTAFCSNLRFLQDWN